MTSSTDTSKARDITFGAATIKVKNREYPVEYAINPNGRVTAFVAMNDGSKTTNVRIELNPDHAKYAEALVAAKQERAMREAQRAAVAQAAPVDSAPEPVPASVADPVPVAQPVKAEVQVVFNEFAVSPERLEAAELEDKTQAEKAKRKAPVTVRPDERKFEFIGMEIKGNGWKITFDGSYDRTRVIFKKKPSDTVRAAVKAAGFYWSPVLKSWNKKLTRKAYMAAQELSLELRKLCA